MAIWEVPLEAFAYEAITVSGTPIGFTRSVVVPTDSLPGAAAMFSVETATVRFRVDGSDPSSSVGHLLAIGDVITVYGVNNLINFRGVKVGSDASLLVTYMR